MNNSLNYLYDNLYNLTEEEKKYLLVVINNIINKESELTDIEKKLLIKYSVMEKCLYYGYPIVEVEFPSNDQLPKKIESAGGWYSREKNKIFITPATLNDEFSKTEKYPFFAHITNNVERILLTVLHECEHYFQNYDFRNNRPTLRNYYYLIKIVFNTYLEDEYKKNYSYKQIENEANIKGWHDAGLFLAQHGYKKEIDNIPFLQSYSRKELSNQKDERKQLIEDYNVSILVRLCYQHPGLVNKCPLLKNFFVDSGYKIGTLKNPSVLVEEYNKLARHNAKTSDMQAIYREFFNCIYGKDVNYIDKNSGLVVLDLIVSELASLQGVFDFKYSKPGEKKQVVQRKVERILKYYDAIKKLNLLSVTDEPFGRIEDIIFNSLKETLKVYETSKEMYNNLDDDIESQMNKLRTAFSYNDIEKRPADGRTSALNI